MKSLFSAFAFALHLFTSHANLYAASATYEIQFTNLWNKADHVSFPNNAHFSPILAVTHNDDFALFKMGELASAGLEQLAESGATDLLSADIRKAKDMGSAKESLQSAALFPKRDGNHLTMKIRVSSKHDLLSFATMIAPSPDWIVGVDSLDTHIDGAFIQSAEFELFALNAGTEEGDFAGNFSINNRATNPAQPLASLDHIPGLAMPFAKVKIVKIQ